jgi:gamma-glutamyltranspeptidase / glutathione hydrolase
MLRLLLLLLLPLGLWAEASPPASAIASAHPLATEAGMAILAEGGNAFDAAITVSAVLAVVEPYGSGMGGGGFWLLHRASDHHEVMIDGRERAPLAAHRDMYLDAHGDVIPDLSMNGPLAAAVPGQAAALAHMARHYGRLPLHTTLAPAIRLAREGFEVSETYRTMAEFRLERLRDYPQTAAIFLQDGDVPALGHRIVQRDLAETLERFARDGHGGFYQGQTGAALIEAMSRHGGIWRQADLDGYRVIEREPLRFHYHGHEIVSAPPPSSGGVALATMLNILRDYPLADLDPVSRTHLLTEAMRRAYRDRARYLGDSDFVSVPLERLVHPHYGAGLAATIHPERATPSDHLPGPSVEPGGHHTSHFSILDREGNHVAATLSINYPFGSGFVAPGTGLLLNNEMDDFSAKPGSPNAYGLVGAEANAIAPGKRMLSSMSPTFVRSDERLAILGTPGGSRIITMVLQGILAHVQGEPVQHWVAQPRIHHQYLPDRLYLETGALSEAHQQALHDMGHHTSLLERPWGNMQAIVWDRRQQQVSAASDPRGEGSARIVAVH